MKNKNSSFPYEFLEQFAKVMAQSSVQQTEWWKQAGLTLQTTKQMQEFMDESQSRLNEYMAGVKLYQQTDFKRKVTEPPVIWAMGGAKLLDYSQTKNSKAPVLLIIPSLINRSYVLDMTEETSFMRQLAKAGIRSFLLDWGDLTTIERSFSVEEYVNRYILNVIDHVSAYTNQSISVMGYCMGGMLAIAATTFRPKIKKMVLLATPWDFHAGQEWLIPWVYASSAYLNKMIDKSSELPVEIIQYMFAVLNPMGVIRKFRELPQFADDIEKLQEFASVEDWLNDCVPLAPKVAKEVLFDWYRDNKPIKGEWVINDTIIDLKTIPQQTLVIVPQNDKIISPKSADLLTKNLPDNHTIRPDTGHIGAVIGKKAEAQVLQPIISFIKDVN